MTPAPPASGRGAHPANRPASGDEEARRRYDPGQRLTAARISHASPHWLVIWGTHSRRLWAFPLFAAPPGTIVSASGPGMLAARMRQAEAAADAVHPR